MRACILSIGSELILGQITDTNAAYLAQELSAVGIDLIYVTQVGDDRALLLDAMRHSLAYADVLICTGGIGPTDDDLTRETIAELVGEDPVIDDALLHDLVGFFRGRGQEMPERNRKQAWVIPSSTVLPNPVGTAPGWFVQHEDKVIVTMPGVPREMFRMWTEQVLPRILERADDRVIDSVHIKTIGIGESAAEQILHDLIVAADPQVATYAKDDGVHIRITAFGNDPADARRRRDACRSEVLRRLEKHVWGEDRDTLQGVVARDLSARGLRLAIREFGTGGALSSLLAADPASAACFDRDIAEPSPSPGTELEEIAVRSAAEMQRDNQGTLGIALVYAGSLNDRGVSEGELIATVADPVLPEPQMFRWHLRGSLPDIQRRAALSAIEALRKHLKG